MKFRFQILRAGITGPAPHFRRRLYLQGALLEGVVATGDRILLPTITGDVLNVPIEEIENHTRAVVQLNAVDAAESVGLFNYSMSSAIDPTGICVGVVVGDAAVEPSKFRLQIHEAEILGPAPHFRERLVIRATLLDGEIADGNLLQIPTTTGEQLLVRVWEIWSDRHRRTVERVAFAGTPETIGISSVRVDIDPTTICLGILIGDATSHGSHPEAAEG